MGTSYDIEFGLALTSCILSFIGSILIIYSWFLFPTLRKPARKVLVYLSAADLLTSIVYMISLFTCHQIKNTIFHLIQTLLGIAFPISSFVWTDCLSIYVYGVSTGQDWVMHENWLFRRFFFAAWFIPLICIFLLCIYEYANQGRYDNLGTNTSTGGWCWVTTLTEKLIGGKVVEIASYGIIVFFYYRSWRILKDIERRQLRNTNDKSNGVLQRLLLVPVLFICFRIWSTIRIFTEKFDAGPRVDRVLRYFQAAGDPAQGFVNAVIFIFFHKHVRGRFYAHFCCIPYVHLPRIDSQRLSTTTGSWWTDDFGSHSLLNILDVPSGDWTAEALPNQAATPQLKIDGVSVRLKDANGLYVNSAPGSAVSVPEAGSN